MKVTFPARKVLKNSISFGLISVLLMAIVTVKRFEIKKGQVIL